MEKDDMDADRSIPRRCLTAAEVRRFQAAFAVQMCLFTGLRSGEVLRAIDKMTAERLSHKDVRTTARYLDDSGLCHADQLATRSSYAAALRGILASRSLDDSTSPFTRVYQDQGRGDALDAHLAALRGQLGD
jgi:integrase